MATDDRKIQLGVSVDATEARQGFEDVKNSAREMAQAVVTQGNTAGKAVDSIGSGGANSASKVEAATRSMIQSIQRTTAAMEAGSKSSSAYYEALASQRGIPTDALSPYLAQLDAARAKQDAAADSMSNVDKAAQKFMQTLQSEAQALKDEAATFGMTKTEVLAYQAAKLGISQSAAPFIEQINREQAALRALRESTVSASAAVNAFGETEAQAAARISDMVARSREVQAAMTATASAAATGAGGVGALGASADQVRSNLTAQTAAMSSTTRELAAVNEAMDQFRASAAQGTTSFDALYQQFQRLDLLMAKGKVTVEQYDAATAQLWKDEDRLAQQLSSLTGRYDPIDAAARKLAADQAILEDAFKNGQVSAEQYSKTLAGIEADKASVQLRNLAQQEAALEKAMKSGQVSMADYKKSLADINASKAGLAEIANGANDGAKAMDGFGTHTKAARTEMLRLANDLATGNFGRFEQSAMVLAEQMDLLGKVASPTGVAILGVAAAVGGFVAATVHVQSQLDEMNRALVMTGDYAGTTVDGLRDMAQQATAGGASINVATEAITKLAATGRLTADEIGQIGQATADAATYMGVSVDKMVEMFGQLAKDPAKAAQTLNEQYHFLTVSTYDQITALEKQGDATGAAQVAVEAFSKAMEERTQDIAKNEGIILQGWRDIRNAISEAIEAVGTFGATATPGQVVARLQANKAARLPIGQWDDSDEAELQKAIGSYNDALAKAREKAAADRHNQEVIDAKRSYDTWNSQFATPAEKRAKEIQTYIDTIATPLGLSADQQLADEAKIDDKYKDKKSSTRGAGLVDRTALTGDVQAIKDALAEQIAAVTAAEKQLDTLFKGGGISIASYYQQSRDLIAQRATDEIDAYNKEAAVLSKGLNDQKLSAQQRAQINNQIRQDQAKASKATEQFFNAIAESAAKEDELWQKYGQSQLDVMQKQIDAANQQDQSLKDQIDTFGMGKAAIDALKASRADDTVAALEQGRAIALMQNDLADTQPWDDAITKAKQLAAALHGVADDQAILDQKEAVKKAADQAVQDWKSAANSIESGITNALMNGFNSGKSFGQQLVDSLKAMFKTLVLQPIISPIAGGAASMMYPGGAQAYAQQNPNSPMTSLLQNPYGTYQKLSKAYDTVVNWIQGYGGASTALGSAAIAGASSGALSAGGATLGGLSGAIGGDVAASAGTYGASLGANAYGFTAGSTSGSLGLGGTLGSSAGLMYGGAGLLGGLAGGALFGNKGYSSLGGSLGAMGGLALGASTAVAGTTIGASLGSLAGPIGAIAGMVLGSALGSLIGGGETRYGASYTSDGTTATKFAGPSGGDPGADQVTQQINATYSTIQSMASQLGGDISGLGQYKASYEISPSKGNSFVSAGFTNGSDWYPDRQDLSGVKDSATVLDDFSLQLQRSIITSLKKANLDTPYADLLSGVDASTMSATDITALVNELSALKSMFDSFKNLGSDFDNLKNASTNAKYNIIQLAGGIDSLNSSTSYFYQHFTDAGTQVVDQAKSLADQMSALGYTGINTRDQFKDLVESLDLSTDAGQKAYVSLLNLAPAFDAVATAAETAIKTAYDTQSQALTTFRDQLVSFRASLVSGDLADLSPETQYNSAKATYQDLLAKANAGDTTAQGGLTQAAQDFLSASKAYNASSSQYQSDLASVLDSIDAAKSNADQQLDLMKQQVAGIIDINDSVITLAQALEAYKTGTPVDGSHAGGLYRVPFDGYIAELHQGERVLTAAEAKQADTALSGASVSVPAVDLARYQQRDTDALLTELKAQREQNAKQTEVIAKLLAARLQQADTQAKDDAQRMDQQTALLQQQKRPGQA
ncbi:phage tail length tape measure family protein [Caballeronia sp. AZ7_KS35]|uniref:phage tail length tape measure family protein n=1 Tax=Caballeronia sp. AZ7_KS35 TaxID=2921762 RepID=UPI00202815FB|nr:phage tail length tape measure family protein [Caballeronia sp. AZ7_KS35]